MKSDIHPKYNKEVTVKCACGNEFKTGSTRESLSVEICAKCHPYFTGKQKFIDTAQRLKKFEDRKEKSKELSAAYTKAKKKRAEKVAKKAEVKKAPKKAEKKPAKKTAKKPAKVAKKPEAKEAKPKAKQ